MPDDCQRFDCCGDQAYTYEVERATPNPVPIDTFTVTITVDPTGSGTTTGSGTWAANTFVTITAKPSAGYVFDSWSGDYQGTVSPASVYIDGDKAIVANFVVAGAYLTLIADPQGSATFTGGGPYNQGDTATFQAFPVGSFQFTGWSGDITSVNNPESILMDSDKTITATMTRPIYELDVAAGDGGSATGSGTYPAGTIVTISASPDDGYFFSRFTGDVVSTSPIATVLMDGNKNVQAVFAQMVCQSTSYSFLSANAPTTSTVIKVVTPDNPGPPGPGYQLKPSCRIFVVITIVNNTDSTGTVDGCTAQFGTSTTGIDFTTQLWNYIAKPTVQGNYVYEIDFSGWRKRKTDTTPASFIPTDRFFTIKQNTYPGITN
jgi:hypothetical protein